MEKQQFTELLGRYSQSSENEALTVMSLKEYFPYSQVLHALSARITKDHRFREQQDALQMAAVYAADRAVLKQVMTNITLLPGKTLPPFLQLPLLREASVRDVGEFESGREMTERDASLVETIDDTSAELTSGDNDDDLTRPRTSDAGALSFQQKSHGSKTEVAAIETTELQVPAEAGADDVQQPKEEQGVETVRVAADNVRQPDLAMEPEETHVADQVMSDLEKLNQLKHNFEALFEANRANILLRDAARTIGVSPADEALRLQQARERRIAELVSSLDPELNESAELGELEYPAETGNILEEIKNSKQEIVPEDEKQRDQLRLIDDFIKTQPSLGAKDNGVKMPEDLSTIKTGEFSDNIVSETLVDILVKQGKKDKAIEVLKKLIWKFPQKKAYFAAQIEDLKK